MGIDFLQRTNRSFERSCQRGYDDLKRTRLFDPAVSVHERTILVRLTEAPPSAETPVYVRAEHQEVGLYCDERKIGSCPNPPATIVDRLSAAELGMALAQIAAVHPFSGTADISIV
jgi:hypothetical protein